MAKVVAIHDVYNDNKDIVWMKGHPTASGKCGNKGQRSCCETRKTLRTAGTLE